MYGTGLPLVLYILTILKLLSSYISQGKSTLIGVNDVRGFALKANVHHCSKLKQLLPKSSEFSPFMQYYSFLCHKTEHYIKQHSELQKKYLI